jgi:hypothetical protein
VITISLFSELKNESGQNTGIVVHHPEVELAAGWLLMAGHYAKELFSGIPSPNQALSSDSAAVLASSCNR